MTEKDRGEYLSRVHGAYSLIHATSESYCAGGLSMETVNPTA